MHNKRQYIAVLFALPNNSLPMERKVSIVKTIDMKKFAASTNEKKK